MMSDVCRIEPHLVLVLVLAGCGADSGPPLPIDTPPPSDFVPQPNPKSASMFPEETIAHYALTFPANDWTAVIDTWQDPKWKDPASQAVWEAEKKTHWVHCGFTFEGETAAGAACRLRGNPTDWAYQKKPQLAVRFNHFDKEARFRGLRGVSLEHFNVHAAPVRDRLGMMLMRGAGLPAPRVAHVRVDIDGTDYGIYMAIEPVDREFLEDHFADPGGNLYEGAYIKQTNESDPSTDDMDAIDDLLEAESVGADHGAFVHAMASRMDMAQVLRLMAAESVLPSNDNLSNGSTNFFYYHPPGGLFVAIPWDFDDILSPKNSPATSPLYTFLGYSDEPSKLLALVADIPEWRQAFEDDVVALRDGPHAALAAQAASLCAMLRPEMATDEPWKQQHTLDDFDKDCAAIAEHVADRAAFLKTALGR